MSELYEVPAELVELGVDALLAGSPGFCADSPSLRAPMARGHVADVLAAILPEHERQVRAQIALIERGQI